ncbi:hypothetical protein BBJ28_00012215 [Nothophytophthora sp. Chile5]|nr:hypothetical protein BBJ28_00012215 [Nothophytophthora sp. Chile5]
MWQQGSALSSSGTGYVLRSHTPASSASGVDSAPPRRLDMRWSRVTLAQLRDEEFMLKQLRRIEITASARRAGAATVSPGRGAFPNAPAPSPQKTIQQRLLAAQTKAKRGASGDPEDEQEEAAEELELQGVVARESEAGDFMERELHNALCVLGGLEQPELAAVMMQKLKHALQRNCTFPNPVYQLIALRRHILQSMHEAMAAQHRHQQAVIQGSMAVVECLNASSAVSSSSRNLLQLSSDVLSPSSSASAIRPKEKVTREAAMGIQVLLCLLNDLHDPVTSSLAQRKEFMRDLLPLIRSMAPLALLPRRGLSTGPSGVSPLTSRGSAARLLGANAAASVVADISAFSERIQRFLLDLCPRLATKTRPSSSPKLPSIASVNGELDVADHTNAVNGLIHLAAATGSVRDFLVVLRVLLGASDDTASKDPRSLLSSRSPLLTASVPSLMTVRVEDRVASPRNSEHDGDGVTHLKVRTKENSAFRADTTVKSPSPSSKREKEMLVDIGVQDVQKRKALPKGLKSITTTTNAGATMVNIAIPHPRSQHHHLYTGLGNNLVSKQQTKDTLKGPILSGNASLALDMSKMKDLGTRDPTLAGMMTSRGEMPISTARCPKFKSLDVASVLRELDRAKTTGSTWAPKGKSSGSAQLIHAAYLGVHSDKDIFSGDDDVEDREVWSCGQNSYGELGHGDTVARKSFERIESLQQKDVAQVGAGNEHTIALTADGKVLTCGYNDNGQCGQGGTARVSHMSEIPKMGESLVAQVHAYNGCEHTILVTVDGRAASCGYNYRGQLGHGNTASESVPKIMRSLEGKVVRLVSCSYYHTVMACEGDGCGRQYVYTFGRNDYGQLGHNDLIDRKVPQHVEALSDQHVVSVACGQYHTMVVTASGKAFGFGKNDYGQLGMDAMENQMSPVQVRGGLEKQNCLEIRCGYYHSIVLCSGAHLYAFGRNDYGQLGLGRVNASSTANLQLQQQRFPFARLVEELEGKEIIRFACGCYHTVAVSDNGVMYVFGRNNHGQLGTGDTNERMYPYPIDDFVGKRVAMVAAGFYHTIVLTGGKDEEKNDQDPGGNEQGESLSQSSSGGLTHSVILAAPIVQELLDPSKHPRTEHAAEIRTRQMKNGSVNEDAEPGAEVPSIDPNDDDYRDEDYQFTRNPSSEASSRAPTGSMDTLLVAAVVLAQLDRLSQPFVPKQGAYPILQHPTLRVVESLLTPPSVVNSPLDMNDTFDGCFEAYIIHVCSSTFDSLAILMKHLSTKKIEVSSHLQFCLPHQEGPSTSGSGAIPTRPSHSSPSNQVQVYMLGACLRILQANLSQLLRSGLAKVVILLSRGNDPVKPASTTIGEKKPSLEELDRLRLSILQIRDVLVSLIDIKLSKSICYLLDNTPNGGENATKIANEAANTLMQGFELFFPCQCIKRHFFMNTIHEDHVGDPSGQSCGVLCRRDLWAIDALPHSKALLLGPLLKRMTEDSLILGLLPLSSPMTPTTGSTPTTTSKTHRLSSITEIYQLLLDCIASDFARQLGEAVAVSPSKNAPKRQSAASFAYFDTLNGLQKHFFSWAASTPDWVLDDSAQLVPTGVDIEERIGIVIDRVFRVDEKDRESVPLSWRCFIEFALAVTVQCCDVFRQVLSAEPVPSPTHGYARYDSASVIDRNDPEERMFQKMLTAVEHSIVGRLLPSLVVSLFEFSNIPLFAAALLPNLKGVLQMLNAFNQRDSTIDGVERGFVESIASSVAGRPSQKTSGGSFRRKSVGSSLPLSARGEDSKALSSRGLTISDAMALPWNYRLEKELAVLAAEMAVTLVAGDPIFACDFQGDVEGQGSSNNPVCSGKVSARWISSPLFRGGLRLKLFGRSIKQRSRHGGEGSTEPARIVQHTPFPTAARTLSFTSGTDCTPFSLILPPSPSFPELNEARRRRGLSSEGANGRSHERMCYPESVREFLSSLLQSGGDARTEEDASIAAAQKLCEWVRDSYAKRDPSYRMITRQSQLSISLKSSADPVERQIHVNDIRLEAAAFAVLLHHHMLGYQAYRFAFDHDRVSHTTRASPPRTFLSLWCFVAELRRRIAAKKTEIKNMAPKEANGDSRKSSLDHIIDLQQTMLERCKLLLLIEVHEEQEHLNIQLDAGFVAPYDPAFTMSAGSSFPFSTRSVKKHMRAAYTTECVPFLVAFPSSKWRKVRILVHTVMRWKATATAFANKQDLAGGISQEILDYVTSDEDVSSANAIKLLLVDPCRRVSCSARGLELLWELLTLVSFDSIQADIVHQLSQVLVFQPARHFSLRQLDGSQNIGHYYSRHHDEIFSEFLAHLMEMVSDKASLLLEQADGYATTTFWIVIELLSAWGVNFDIEQFEFVTDIGILGVIQQMLQAISSSNGQSARGLNGTSGLASMDSISGRSGGQTATTSKQMARLKDTLWVLFRYIYGHFATQSVQPVIENGVVIRQVICAPTFPLLSGVVDLLYEEAASISRGFLPLLAMEEPPCLESQAVVASPAPGIMRRSFEIIVPPRRFSKLDRGLTSSYDDMISPSGSEATISMSPLLKPNEFSITTWLYINTSSVPHPPSSADFLEPHDEIQERQLVFLRGAGREISLYMLLVPENFDNWQLEVGLLVDLSGSGGVGTSKGGVSLKTRMWERVVSKQIVAGGKWVHVAVVMEAAKLRLYLNGILDCQRSIALQSIPTWAAGNVDLPFHFGRFSTASEAAGKSPPNSTADLSISSALTFLSESLMIMRNLASREADAVLSNNVLSEPASLDAFRCFDGWLCHFRFHNRSLSPIHVRIVFDEKINPLDSSSDAIPDKYSKVMELHALLILLSSSSEGVVHFSAHFPQWLRLLWGTFLGSNSALVQQSALRVLYALLPFQHPLEASQVLLLQDSTQNDAEKFGFYEVEDAFVHQVIRMTGFCLNKCPHEELRRTEEVSVLPWTLTLARGIHRDEFSSVLQEDTDQQIDLQNDIELLHQASKRQSLTIANELIQLLLHLYRCPDNNAWKQSITRVTSRIVSNASRSKDGESLALRIGSRTVQLASIRQLETIGCLYFFSGGVEFLRLGVTVEIRGTREVAQVIALKPDSASRNPSATTPQIESSRATASNADALGYVTIPSENGGYSTLKSSNVPSWYEKVFGHHADQAAHRSGYCRMNVEELGPAAAYSPNRGSGTYPSVLHDMSALRERTEVPRVVIQKAEEFIPDWYGRRISLQSSDADNRLMKAVASSAEGDLLSMRVGCLLLKALVQVAGSAPGVEELLARPGLVDTLVRLSISEDGSPTYETLCLVERKVSLLRQQMYAVLVELGEDGEVELASVYHSNSETKETPKRHEIVVEDQTDTEDKDYVQEQFAGVAKLMQFGTSQGEGQSVEDDIAGLALHPDQIPRVDANEENGDEDEDEADEDEDEDESLEDAENDEEDDEEDEMDESRAEFVEELMLMGFPEDWCVLALKQTENDIVSASTWIVDNLEYLSKLQSTLDKQRDQGRDSPRFDEEDDDITPFDELSGGKTPRLPSCPPSSCADTNPHVGREIGESTAQTEAQVECLKKLNNETSTSVGEGSSGPTVPPLNDKEMGRKIFGEMYFPFEEGGYLSNTRLRFLRSWRADAVEMKATSTPSVSTPQATPGSVSDASYASRFHEELQTEVNQLDLGGLLGELRALERTLSILYARQCVVTLMQQVATLEDDFDGRRCGEEGAQRLMIPYAQCFQLMKLVLLRGDQFAAISRKRAPKEGDQELQESSIESVFLRAFAYFTKNDAENFTTAAFNFCLEELALAASNKTYEAVLWTQRELRRSDKVVNEEPGVEVVAWMLDTLLAESKRTSTAKRSVSFTKQIVRRLRCCLSTTNLPLKLVILRTITRSLAVLSSAATGEQRQEIARESQLEFGEFLGAARLRHSREWVQDRLLFSQYLQAYVELLHVLQSLTDIEDQRVASHLIGDAPRSIGSNGDTVGPSQSMDLKLPPATPGVQRIGTGSLLFDRKRSRSSLLTFAEDGLSVSYSGNEVWKAACATVSFSTGVHSWVVHIEKSSSPYLFVGVATRRANLDSFLGADEQSWGFIGDKALYYQRNRVRAYGETFTEGDCIGLTLDCEKGELSFSKNGVALGVAFDNVVGEVCPAVAFYSRHQKIAFGKDSYISSDDTIALPSGEDGSASVEDCLVACEVMANLVEKKRMRASVSAAAHTMTVSWLSDSTKFVTTRSDKSLWVDVTRESCGKLGFHPDDRVRTPRGNGVVVGMAAGRIWVEVDGEPGAWFFHPSKLRLLTLANVTTAALPDPPIASARANASPSAPPPSRDDPLQQAGGSNAARSTSTEPCALALSHEELVGFGEHSLWNLAADRELVNVANDFCEVSRISPWNVTPSELIALVREKAPALELTAMASVLALPRETHEKLVVARFALLRFCNLYVSRALPFFDLTWHYFLPESSSRPCQLISQCRGSLFVCVKNSLFTALMNKTANSPKRGDDEYDYPEDLPQLQVNRLKAAAAKCHPGTTNSLFLSLFGQAFEELHFLPLKTLRMVYSHPMDDGQLRSFKVKFEGEGVDDYGGPYREFFSQFFAELQMLQVPQGGEVDSDDANRAASGKQESGGSVSACLLPFLMPSPNWRNGVGANREKFVLNSTLISGRFDDGAHASGSGRQAKTKATVEEEAPAAPRESAEEKRQLYCEMFFFLGQMVGLCLRTRVCVRLDLAMTVWKQLVAEDDSDPESALATLKEIDFVAYSLWKTLKTLLDEFKRADASTDAGSDRAKARRREFEEQLEAMDLDFTTVLSDGQTVELCVDGSNTTVTLANLEQYLDAVLLARIQETQEVMNIVKQGLNSILPVSAMALLTWSELEKRMCGVAEVDVKLLQANTEYDEELSASDEFIQRFWRVLESLESEDKRAFLRFVWARSRLPLGSAQFHQKFKIQALASSGTGDGGSSPGGGASSAGGWMDSQLPKSHTCFFALQLPRYSTDEICRTRMLYAVRNCVEMDGDFRLADTEMTGCVLFGKRRRSAGQAASHLPTARSSTPAAPAASPDSDASEAETQLVAKKPKSEKVLVASEASPSGMLISFLNLGVDPWLVKRCELLGIRHPTPVQAHCIPPILAGRDVIGCAQTGSGKTAAFALPILHTLSKDPYGPYALVLTPTRELAFQIADQFNAFGSSMAVRCAVVVGGVDMLKQALTLQQRPHVIVATPGRFRDHLLRTNPPNISLVKYVVLDEADRLLDVSFAKDLSFIFDKLPAKRQTLLFSATMTANLDRLEQTALADDAFRFDATPSVKTVATLKQFYLFIPAQVKMTYLMFLMSLLDPSDEDAEEEQSSRKTSKSGSRKGKREQDVEQLLAAASSKRQLQSMMIFVSTCKMCELVGEIGNELGTKCVTLHSMMTQNRRLAALGKFKSGVSHILVSTDVASRGLDIPEVDIVLNFDLPRDADDYIHRVGRTARAGRNGQAISLVTQHDIELLQNIEAKVGKKMADFEPQAQEKDVLKLLNDVTTASRVAKMRLTERGFDDKVHARKAKRQEQQKPKQASRAGK